MSLFKTKNFDEAIDQIKGKCEIAAITKSSEGSVILTEKEEFNIPSIDVQRVVDTTGAGDLYAAGFLYGYTQGEPLQVCGKYATIMATEVIQQMGARVQGDLSRLIEKKKIVNG